MPLVYSSAALLCVPHGVAFGLIKVLLQLAIGDRDLFHDGNLLPGHVYCRLFIHSCHPLANTVTHTELSTSWGIGVSPHPHGHISGIQIVFVFLQEKEQRRLQRHLVADHHPWVVQIDILGLRGDHRGWATTSLALIGPLSQLRRLALHLQQLLYHLLKRVCERGQFPTLAWASTALGSPVASFGRCSSAQVAFRPMAPHARGISQGRSSHATEVWNNHSKEQDGHHSSNLVELEGRERDTERKQEERGGLGEGERTRWSVQRASSTKLAYFWSIMHHVSLSSYFHPPLFVLQAKKLEPVASE